jgi:hypothetical protein
MTETLIARIKAGALIKDARLKPGANWLENPWTASLALGLVRKIYGGLWVGGFAELRADSFQFVPNHINEAMTSGSLRVAIPLQTVTSISWRPGMWTGIIDLVSCDEEIGIFSFRVEKRDAFIDLIKSAVAALKKPDLVART